jgi:hypothetical protein
LKLKNLLLVLISLILAIAGAPSFAISIECSMKDAAKMACCTTVEEPTSCCEHETIPKFELDSKLDCCCKPVPKATIPKVESGLSTHLPFDFDQPLLLTSNPVKFEQHLYLEPHFYVIYSRGPPSAGHFRVDQPRAPPVS